MTTTTFKIKLGAKNSITAFSNHDIPGKDIVIDMPKIRSLIIKVKRSITNTNANNAVIHVRSLGKYLYKILFADKEIYANFYFNFTTIAKSPNENYLRLVLQIDEPYLQSLPWELLHDDASFLGPNNKIRIVRKHGNIPDDIGPKDITGKLRILIISSIPKKKNLKYAKIEREQIVNLLIKKISDKVEIHLLSNEFEDNVRANDMIRELGKPTLENILEVIKNNSYNVIHYIGHSEFNDRSNKGTILLCDEKGRGKEVEDSKFAGLFIESNRTKYLGLIMLNSCESGIERGFNGLARQLMETKNIPCVIGMQFKIHDEVGALISKEFYEEFIGNYDAEKAILSTQERLYYNQKFGDTAEFISPIIYTSSNKERILQEKNNPFQDLCEKFKQKYNRLDWSTLYKITEGVTDLEKFCNDCDTQKASYEKEKPEITNILEQLKRFKSNAVALLSEINKKDKRGESYQNQIEAFDKNFDDFKDQVNKHLYPIVCEVTRPV